MDNAEQPPKTDEKAPQSDATGDLTLGAIWRLSDGQKRADGLPPFTQTFWFQYRSEIHGKTLTGEFTLKKLTVAEVAQVGVRRSQLNGGQAPDKVDAATDYINMWLGQFEHSIKDAPEWWAPFDEQDDDLLKAVWDKVVAFEASFRKPVAQQLPGNAKTGEGQHPQKPAGDLAAVVGEQVQDTAHVG